MKMTQAQDAPSTRANETTRREPRHSRTVAEGRIMARLLLPFVRVYVQKDGHNFEFAISQRVTLLFENPIAESFFIMATFSPDAMDYTYETMTG